MGSLVRGAFSGHCETLRGLVGSHLVQATVEARQTLDLEQLGGL